MKSSLRFVLPVLFTLASLASLPAMAQDWVHTGSNLGNAKIRIAAADFKPVGADPQTPALKATFDSTLYSDLENAGVFDMVSKSFAPQATPGSPQEINLAQWSADPAKASMVAFGVDPSNGDALCAAVRAGANSTIERLIGPPAPRITQISLIGTNVVIRGTNGPAAQTYYALASTNIVLPATSWVSISTSLFDAGGSFAFTNPVAPDFPRRFYRLLMP